ncbi:MAG: hypothetical protein ACOCP4_00715 [Candidatus Woesearchaeota archaeon]
MTPEEKLNKIRSKILSTPEYMGCDDEAKKIDKALNDILGIINKDSEENLRKCKESILSILQDYNCELMCGYDCDVMITDGKTVKKLC